MFSDECCQNLPGDARKYTRIRDIFLNLTENLNAELPVSYRSPSPLDEGFFLEAGAAITALAE